MRDRNGPDLEHVDPDAAEAASGATALPLWRLAAGVGVVVVVVLLGIIAYELHRQSEYAQAAGCYERTVLLRTFDNADTDPQFEAALRCLGVQLTKDGGSCVTITFKTDASLEQIDAFAAGILAGTGTSGSPQHQGVPSNPTVVVGIRAAEVQEVLEQADRTGIVAAATASPRARSGVCG